MLAHRQAFPTPRGYGKSDPEGGRSRPPDLVATYFFLPVPFLGRVFFAPRPVFIIFS